MLPAHKPTFYNWPTRAVDGWWRYRRANGDSLLGVFGTIRDGERPVFRTIADGRVFCYGDFTFEECLQWTDGLGFPEEHVSAFADMRIPNQVLKLLFPHELSYLEGGKLWTVEGVVFTCCLDGLFKVVKRLGIPSSVASEYSKFWSAMNQLDLQTCATLPRLKTEGAIRAHSRTMSNLLRAKQEMEVAVRQELLCDLRDWVHTVKESSEEEEGSTTKGSCTPE